VKQSRDAAGQTARDRLTPATRTASGLVRWLAIFLVNLAIIPLACGSPANPVPAKPVGQPGLAPLPADVTGLMTYQRDGNVYTLPVDAKADRKITDFPLTSPAVFSARSPDGSRLAYVRIEGMGSTLWVGSGDGSDPKKILDESATVTTLERPQWTPDGTGIVFTYHGFVVEGGSVKGELFRAERVDADGGNRTVLAPDAEGPSLAPDGSLTFVRTTRAGQQLVLLPPDGTEKVLVADRTFLNVAAPRFSHDGKRIAFSAVGDGPKVGSTRAPGLADLLQLGTPVAWAHGEPWDIWLADVSGAVRRLSKLTEDEPTTAWGEGDRYVAVSGGTGVYVVDAASGSTTQLVQVGGFGGIDWTR
jgi:Tol biopolymer transport system component